MEEATLEARRDASGGYKVDVSRGERSGRVSSEWFSRLDDERFLLLSDLQASVRSRVRAQVSETGTDRTIVTGKGANIGGDCSCLAFSDYGPCKHIVATALTANVGGEAGSGALTRIRAHLETKDAAALLDMLVNLADCDPAIFQRLDLAGGASRARP